MSTTSIWLPSHYYVYELVSVSLLVRLMSGARFVRMSFILSTSNTGGQKSGERGAAALTLL